jgi:hypothetical protein
MPDLIWIQTLTLFLALSIVTIFAVLFLVGWIITKRQHDAEIKVYRDALDRAEAARIAEYNRMDREYARMVNAKDLAITQAETYAAQWRAHARQAVTGLEVTTQQAAAAVEHVAAKLPPPPEGSA